MCSSDLTFVAGSTSNSTEAFAANPVPVIVTVEPPALVPTFGVTPLTVTAPVACVGAVDAISVTEMVIVVPPALDPLLGETEVKVGFDAATCLGACRSAAPSARTTAERDAGEEADGLRGRAVDGHGTPPGANGVMRRGASFACSASGGVFARCRLMRICW